MGTNYYIRQEICPCCGHAESEYHIGKSSGGWCFSLHVEPERNIHDLEDVMAIEGTIFNEYGDIVSRKEMMAIITEREWHSSIQRRNIEKWKETNYAVEGPNGLWRHKIDGVHCIGHGSGTYDLLIGEFS